MSWSNVKLILFREIRDQLRDRRTLFVICVIPIMLYPLVWMSFLQITQFMEDKPSTVLIVGAANLPDSAPRFPPQVDRGPAAGEPDHSEAARPEAHGPSQLLDWHFPDHEASRDEAGSMIEKGQYDAAIYFPPDFGRQMEAFHQAFQDRLDRAPRGESTPRGTSQGRAGRARRRSPDLAADGAESGDPRTANGRTSRPRHPAREPATAPSPLPGNVPRPEIIYSTASEKSQIAFKRVSDALERWRDEIVKKQLAAVGLPFSATQPFDVQTADVAEASGRRDTAMWSKVLPLLLLVWAMTGAFYPAIDLCAGEKERGTLETLLSSPAERSEIVMGKLVTIMIFSMASAVWNLVAIGASGALLLARLPEFGLPPPSAALWLAAALVPASALFSALSLALAAFARSAKEGQYYFLPLLVIAMPLIVLPMAPGVELNLGNSLIPVSGLVLLLRSMLEGNFSQDWPLAIPVAAVTLGCCLLAIRWAVRQFNSESVLFRESERLDVRLWLRHLLEDRGATPTVAMAAFCGVLCLLAFFFISLAVPEAADFPGFAVVQVGVQLAAIAAPALVMALVLTTSPRQTLLLRVPAWPTLLASASLAVVLHPAVQALQAGVMRLYPPKDPMQQALGHLQGMINAAPLWQVLLVLALTPAVCEELAFRGFILSGFRRLAHQWTAIIYSAVFFGLIHTIFQQQLIACVLGVVIGWLAVRSGSILPGMVFHVVHNSLMLTLARLPAGLTSDLLDRWPVFGYVVASTDQGQTVLRWPAVVGGALLALPILWWFGRFRHPKRRGEEPSQCAQIG